MGSMKGYLDLSVDLTRRRVVIRTPVPLSDLMKLSEILSVVCGEGCVVDGVVSQKLGVVMAACRPEDSDTWRKELEGQPKEATHG